MADSEDDKVRKGVCPTCDSRLIFAEGCKHCQSCGWSACSVG